MNADTTDILKVSKSLYDNNLYAYCDCNPIIRVDSTGDVWETVFDVASLAGSVVEVAMNPTDVMAWAGFVGDAFDLIPFVTGLGETVKVINASSKADDVLQAAKAMKKKVNKSVGVYEITYKSGKNYVGKGKYTRALKSASDHAKANKDKVTSIRWKASKNSRQAFKEEYALQTLRGVRNASTYNKIWSPGKKYYLKSRSSCLSWKF